jgi:hypothetical protein
MSQPCVKFVISIISYAGFVSLLIVSSLQFAQVEKESSRFSVRFPVFKDNLTEYVERTDLRYRFFQDDFYLRASVPNTIDLVISIWVVGLFWHEFKQAYSGGLKDYFTSINNMIDIFMIMLYIASFTLKYYTIFVVRLQLTKVESEDFWIQVAEMSPDDYAMQNDVFSTFYWLNEDRFYWLAFDPVVLAEALFALANLFSIGRICFFLPANQNLGPLQITLGQMINVILIERFFFKFYK